MPKIVEESKSIFQPLPLLSSDVVNIVVEMFAVPVAVFAIIPEDPNRPGEEESLEEEF